MNQIRNIISLVVEELGQENVSPWIQRKIDTIERKTEILKVHRQKRGLMNIVGKAGKWLFGTMDQEDKEEISNHLQTLKENNYQAIQQLNKQIVINDFFNKTLQLLNQKSIENLNQLEKGYNNLSNEVLTLIKHQKTLDATLKLQILEDNINVILDNIASAKIGALHPGILTVEEITGFQITAEKLENARSGILLIDTDTLIINIQIPTKLQQVPHLLLIPLPDRNFHEISEESQAFVEYNKTKYIAERKIMYKRELKPLKTCLNTECSKRINQNEEIVKINENIILGVNLNKTKILNKCDVRNLELIGNYLLVIRNCTIIINHVVYSHVIKDFEENNVFEIFKDNWKRTNVTFEKVAIQQVKNLEYINEIKLQKKINFGINGVFFAIVIILIFVIIYLILTRKNYSIKEKSITNTIVKVESQERCPSLQEGVVMYAHSSREDDTQNRSELSCDDIRLPNFAIQPEKTA